MKETNEIVQEIYKLLDYKLNYKKRIKLIEKINKEYGEELQDLYIYYKTSDLSKFQNKSAYDKICNVYDKLSEYILLCDEVKNNYNKDFPYKQESNLKSMQSSNDISLESYVHSMMKDENRNIKKYDDQNHAVYTLKMFEDKISQCPYVKDYVVFNTNARKIINHFDSILKHLHNNGCKKINCLVYYHGNARLEFTETQIATLKRSIGYTKNNSKEIDQDLIYLIKTYFGIFYFKNPLKESFNPRRLDIDFMDEEHVKGLIKASCLYGLDDKMDYLLDRLKKYVYDSGATEFERKIYHTFKKGKGIDINWDNFEENILNISECAEILDRRPDKLNKSLESLVHKVCSRHEEVYEDWYYTYIVKGSYKKCSKCNEVKIANERYFSINKSSPDNLNTICKKCRRKQEFCAD